LVEGNVDLAFYEDLPDFVGWTVVDLKTDRRVEAMSIYIAQVRLYLEAVKGGDELVASRVSGGNPISFGASIMRRCRPLHSRVVRP
jgi:hypothetical protein